MEGDFGAAQTVTGTGGRKPELCFGVKCVGHGLWLLAAQAGSHELNPLRDATGGKKSHMKELGEAIPMFLKPGPGTTCRQRVFPDGILKNWLRGADSG